MTMRSKGRWRRFSLGGLMIVVAIVAVGLGEYRRRIVIPRQEVFRVAEMILNRTSRNNPASHWEPNLGSKSADGNYQQVVFTDRTSRQSKIVVVPMKPWKMTQISNTNIIVKPRNSGSPR